MKYRHFHFEALGCSNVGDASVVRHVEILLSPLGCLAFAETRRGRPCFFWNGKMGFLQESGVQMLPGTKSQTDRYVLYMKKYSNSNILNYICIYMYAIYHTCCFF